MAQLNPPQREAVTTLRGPILVLAGAGTGKTRVITYRLAELIRSGIRPDRILSVTFTNKASREMRQRTADLLGRRLPAKPLISTFHALCVRILRREIALLGYPTTFAIYDRGDQESVARTALRDIRVSEKSMTPGDLLARISRWKTAAVLPEHAADHVENDLDFLASVAYRKYQSRLRATGALDFDDLLLLTMQLFYEQPAALERQQQLFDHVQIDEYQDTNGIQFQLIEALVRPHRNLLVVGDDDQSIYGWRGAEVTHILNFQHHFPEAKVVRLEDNYRCTDRILAVANQLVQYNQGRHEKTLRAHKQATSNVRMLEFPDELSEAESIVGEIRQLHEQGGVPARKFAILFRTNEQPRLFETELRRASLKYTLIGSQSFFDRREIRDLLAYLRAISNPQDEHSLLRIINTPSRGIGDSTVQKLLERAVKQGRPLQHVVNEAADDGLITRRAEAAINSFYELLQKYRDRLQADPKNMAQTVRKLIEEIDYESEICKQYKAPDQQLARSAMLEQFVDSVQEYVDPTTPPTTNDFLDETALEGPAGTSEKDDKLADDAIKLMTIHSAKGLEFPRVYLVGLEDGLLPHQRSIDADSTDSIAEERRLAYVAITRAEDHLTVSRAATRMKWGKRRATKASRFLYEMFDDYVPDPDLVEQAMQNEMQTIIGRRR